VKGNRGAAVFFGADTVKELRQTNQGAGTEDFRGLLRRISK